MFDFYHLFIIVIILVASIFCYGHFFFQSEKKEHFLEEEEEATSEEVEEEEEEVEEEEGEGEKQINGNITLFVLQTFFKFINHDKYGKHEDFLQKKEEILRESLLTATPVKYIKDKFRNSHLYLYVDTFLLYSFLIVYNDIYHQSFMDIPHFLENMNTVFHLDQLLESEVDYYNDASFFVFREWIDCQNIDFYFVRQAFQKLHNRNRRQIMTTNVFFSFMKSYQWAFIINKFKTMLIEIQMQKNMYQEPLDHNKEFNPYSKEFSKMKQFIHHNKKRKNHNTSWFLSSLSLSKNVKKNNPNQHQLTDANNSLENSSEGIKWRQNRILSETVPHNLSKVTPINHYNANKFKSNYGLSNNPYIPFQNKILSTYFTPLNKKCQHKFDQCSSQIQQ